MHSIISRCANSAPKVVGRLVGRSQLRCLSSTKPDSKYDESSKNAPYIQGSETHFGFESVGINEKEGRVKQVFENVADSYDVMNDFMSGGLHRYWKDQLLDMSAVASMAQIIRKQQSDGQSLRILDVAGGTGDISFRFLEAAGCPERARSSGTDPISVTVCDINGEMLRVGEARARKKYGSSVMEGSKALSFVEGNAQDLHQFEDNSFDLYTIAFGLRNVTDVVSYTVSLRLTQSMGICCENKGVFFDLMQQKLFLSVHPDLLV